MPGFKRHGRHVQHKDVQLGNIGDAKARRLPASLCSRYALRRLRVLGAPNVPSKRRVPLPDCIHQSSLGGLPLQHVSGYGEHADVGRHNRRGHRLLRQDSALATLAAAADDTTATSAPAAPAIAVAATAATAAAAAATAAAAISARAVPTAASARAGGVVDVSALHWWHMSVVQPPKQAGCVPHEGRKPWRIRGMRHQSRLPLHLLSHPSITRVPLCPAQLFLGSSGAPVDEAACRHACASNRTCRGFEHGWISSRNALFARCELHSSIPTHTVPVSGYQCLVKSLDGRTP